MQKERMEVQYLDIGDDRKQTFATLVTALHCGGKSCQGSIENHKTFRRQLLGSYPLASLD
jgi:hypothetical protein